MSLSQFGCIIFARTNSRRLKGKILLEFNQIPLIKIIYLRALKVFSKNKVVVATSNRKTDDALVKFCKKNDIQYFRGSEKNVLERSIKCSKKYKFKFFMRICADRPFFDSKIAKKMKKIYESNNYDIVTNVFPKSFPRGLTCEIISLKNLLGIKKNKLINSDREHILNYFYRNYMDFKIKNIKSNFNSKIIKINLSLDTKKDFKKIYRLFSKTNFNPLVSTRKIINLAGGST